MKKLILTIQFLTAAAIGHVFAQTEVIKFEKMNHDFGKVVEGQPAVFTFKFTNNSKTDVTLQSVKASCGCTTPSWTNTPVKPGTVGEIQVSYHTQGRPGPINKSVTVVYDTAQPPVYLYIQGEVIKDSTKKDSTQGFLRQTPLRSLPAGIINDKLEMARISVNPNRFAIIEERN